MADSKETIYVDIDDEITAIIDKVRSSKSKVVALVLPKRASVFQSIVNMKLLKRAAESEKKNVVLVTSEAGLMPLAGAAMLHVAKTPNSKPEIPQGPELDDNPEDANEEDLANLDSQTPIGDLADQAAANSDEVETLTLKDDELPDDNTDKPKTKDFKPPKQKKDKKLSVPNFEKFRLILIIGGAILVLIIIGFITGITIFPKAEINIKTNAAQINVNQDLNLSTTATSMNTKTNTLPAKLASETKTYTAQATATGQKNNGNKASGSVKMTAQICGQVATVADVPAGSGLSSSGQTYITQSNTTFSSKPNVVGSCLVYDATSNTSIIAQSGGTAFNGATSFTVAGRSNVTASNVTSIGGGTDNIVTVVNQTDINTAKSKISPSDSNEKNSLSKKLKSDNYYAITGTYTAGTPNVSSSVDAGQPANTVTVTETINYTMFGVRENDINTIINNDIKKQIDVKNQSILDNGLNQANFNVNAQTSTTAQVAMSATASVGPYLDIDQIRQQSLGKKPADVRAMLMTNQDITDVDVKLSPFFVSSVPKKEKRVNVNVAKPTINKSGNNGSN